MTHNDPEFLDYLAGLDTKTSFSTKKEIDVTVAAALKKTGLKRKLSGKRKAGRVLLIAAAVAAGAVVTAAAAGVNIGDMFRGYFEHSDPEIQKSASPVLTQSQLEILNKSGTPINQSATSNGTTITLRSAVSDAHSAYVLFDVIAPEGTKLSNREYNFQETDAIDEKFGKNSSFTYSVRTQKDDKPNDNKKTFILLVSTSDDLRGQKLKVTFTNFSAIDKDKRRIPIIKGSWKFNVVLDGNIKSKDLTVNKTIHYIGGIKRGVPGLTMIQCNVKTIRLSPLSASITFTDLKGSDDYQIPENLMLKNKSGNKSVIRSTGGSENETFCTMTYLSDSPIDLDSISSITIGDLTVPVT